MPLSQKASILQVVSTLGDGDLVLHGFEGKEGVSTPFRFLLHLSSNDAKIDPSKLLGKSISWIVSPKGDGKDGQWFDGRVFSVSLGATSQLQTRAMQIEVVPWFFLLSHTKNRKVWVEKSLKEITQDIFKKYSDASFEMNLSETYKPFDCLVQCDQSDFAFLSWLWETHGVFYYFKFEKNKHTMVVADSKSAFKECKAKNVNFNPSAVAFGMITSWNHGYKWVNGKASSSDYNFEKPATDLLSKVTSTTKVSGNSSYEIFEYPGGFQVASDGKNATELLLDSFSSQLEIIEGKSTCMGFVSGLKFKLDSHPISSESGKSFVFTNITHFAANNNELNVGQAAGGSVYNNEFTCIPDSVKFRPTRNTPKPLASGIHNAVVVGPSGKEVFTDKYGRVKIQFNWDRDGKKDDKSSFWVRVSQIWAGKSFGFFHLPRVGDEVIVAFEEGDPSRPVIVGNLYNAEQKAPYPLPDKSLTIGFKTHSSPNGGAEDFNEIRFEDDKGKELISVQANKDFKTLIKNDCLITIKNSHSLEIKSDSKTKITDGNMEIDLGKGDRKTTIYGNEVLTVKTGDIKVDAKAGACNFSAAKSIEFKVGPSSLTIDTNSIELKMGSSSVVIDPSGVTIKGAILTFSGTGAAELKAPNVTISGQAMAELKGAIAMVTGSGMAKVSGGITMVG